MVEAGPAVCPCSRKGLMEAAGPSKEDKMNDFGRRVRALDRIKACAEGPQKRVFLTSTECQFLCEYIWWLTDQITYAKAKDREAIMRETKEEDDDARDA